MGVYDRLAGGDDKLAVWHVFTALMRVTNGDTTSGTEATALGLDSGETTTFGTMCTTLGSRKTTLTGGSETTESALAIIARENQQLLLEVEHGDADAGDFDTYYGTNEEGMGV